MSHKLPAQVAEHQLQDGLACNCLVSVVAARGDLQLRRRRPVFWHPISLTFWLGTNYNFDLLRLKISRRLRAEETPFFSNDESSSPMKTEE